MTTDRQPEALRLAQLLADGYDSMAHVMTPAAAELRRLHAENENLRALAATCYAGLGSECDLPEPWLDALNAACNGEPFGTDGLLPFVSGQRKDAERYRIWRDQYADQADEEPSDMLIALADCWTPDQVDAAIDDGLAAMGREGEV